VELNLEDVNGKTRAEIDASGGIVGRDANGRVSWASPRIFASFLRHRSGA
jgi:hypothetical protein